MFWIINLLGDLQLRQSFLILSSCRLIIFSLHLCQMLQTDPIAQTLGVFSCFPPVNRHC